jgi:outer membrane murein-binding lipoprotein Lpp
MTQKQWWAATIVLPVALAVIPGMMALAGNSDTKQKTEAKVTREELKATIDAITNRMENLEAEQKRQREQAAAAQAQQFELMKLLIQKLATTNGSAATPK